MSIYGPPYTSCHRTALFGSRIQPHIRDESMTPKTVTYISDGRGRDNFISFSNGGFRKSYNNNYHTIYSTHRFQTEVIKRCNINPKFSIYKSNGKGRDSYIYYNNGGFYKNPKKLYLRDYDYNPYVNEPTRKNKYDYNRYVKMFRTPKEIKADKILAKQQRATSARLSRPKF